MHYYGNYVIVYSFFDKKQSLLGFVTNEDILNYSTYIHVNIYSSKALPLYLITRIITYPNIDGFQLILLETRLLAKKTKDEYANILGLSTNEYQLLEQGSRTITSGYKREIQQKLNIIASSFSELFNEFLVEIGGRKMSINYDNFRHNNNKDDGDQSSNRILFMYNILLKGETLSYNKINYEFEISETTWKRDIRIIRRSVVEAFGNEVKLLKVKNEKAYILYVPAKEIRMYLS